MKHSEQLNELGKALTAAQRVMRGAVKDGLNPHFRSRYADLESCWDAIREPLTSNGLSVIQTLDESPDAVVVETMLLHISGQWISGRNTLKPVKNDPQGIGSCITYGRRYGLAAIVGLTQTDDDGNHASGKAEIKVEQKPEPKPDKKESPAFDKSDAVKSIRAFLVENKIDEGSVLQMLEDKKLIKEGTVRLDDCPVDIIQKLGSAEGRNRLKDNFKKEKTK